MKKLIFIVCFLIGYISMSFGQSGFPNGVRQDNPNLLRQFDGGIHPNLGFILPFGDTTNNIATVYNGALMQRSIDSKPYYSDGFKWIPVQVGTPTPSWFLSGNTGTTSANFLGTIDDKALIFKVNNIRAGKLDFDTMLTVFGIGAGVGSTSNGQNTLIGFSAGGNYSGIGSTFIGHYSGYLNSGNFNTALGTFSGNAGTGNNNTFIGHYAGSLSTRSNTIAIGFGAISLRDSSGVYGDSTRVKYNGFGTAYPTAMMDIRGKLRLVDGTQSNGYILQSDANGFTSWTANASINQWSILGNSGINRATNFLGTTDNNSLRFRTNNVERMKLDSIGRFVLNGLTSNVSYDSAFSLRSTDGHPYLNVKTNTSVTELQLAGNNIGEISYTRLIHGSFDDSLIATQYRGWFVQQTEGFKINHTGGVKFLAFDLTYSGTDHLLAVRSPDVTSRGVYIGDTTVRPSSVFTVTSTTQGVLLPRMNTTQMNAISSPTAGLLLYQNDSSAFFYNNGGAWVKIGASTGGGGGGGTVTSVATGYGLSGGTIVGSGTLIADSATLANYFLRRKDSTLYSTAYQNSLKQNLVTLTTTGTSGAATFNQGTGALNIPNYAGGSGNANSNIGSGYRLAVPNTNNIKTLFNRFGLLLDSTTNTNGISLYVDSSLISTRFRLQQSITDSLTSNVFYISHALSTTDSLYQVLAPNSIKFKVPKAASPLVLTTIDTAFTYSLPTFIPVGTGQLTINNALAFSGTDGTTFTFPATSDAVAVLGAAQTFTAVNTYSISPVFSGGGKSNASSSSADLAFGGSSLLSSTTDSKYLLPNYTNMVFRVGMGGSTFGTVAANTFYSNLAIAASPITTLSTGTNQVTSLLVRKPGTVTAGGSDVTLNTTAFFEKNNSVVGDTIVSAYFQGKVLILDSAWGKTMATGQNDSTLATTRFVKAAIAAGGAPTFNDVAQQTISTTVTWAGTAPTGATTNTYRWTQIGKHITARFNLAYASASAGTSSQVTIVLPTDMPTPEQPTGFSSSTDYTTVGEGFLSTTKNAVSSERGRSFIQWDGTNFNLIVKITTSVAVQYGYAVIDYWTP